MKRPTTQTTQWIATAACALIALGSLAVSVVFVLEDRSDDQLSDKRELDANFLTCLRGNELRLTIRDKVVEPAYAARSLDLRAVPGFDRLDPATQVFFTNIATASAGRPSPKTQIVADLNEQLRDCEKEWAGHTPGLKLPHQNDASEALPEGTTP